MGATFGQRLRGLRDELGLTMEELVAAFNKKFPDIPLDRSKISRYERGLTRPNRFDVVEGLAYFFGVTPSYLMGRSDKRLATPYRKIPILRSFDPELPPHVQTGVHYEYVREDDAVDFGVISATSIPSARIAPGDIVYIDRHAGAEVESGDLVLAVVESRPALVRYYEADDSIILKAEGVGHDAVISKKGARNFRIIGKAVSFKSEVR